MNIKLSATAREKKIRDIIAKHSDWLNKAINFMQTDSKRMSLNDYCVRQNLPYDEFNDFCNLLVEDVVAAAEKSPFLRQMGSLPARLQNEYARLQNEYARLQNEKRNLQVELAGIYSELIGEKVELKDFYDKKAASRIDSLLKKKLDRKNAHHILATLRATRLFDNIDAIDYELKQFCRKHGLE